MDESERGTSILEINLISAQGLYPPTSKRRRFKTYALAWVDSSSKLRSRLDLDGSHHNPTWNDKFLFRVTPEFLSSQVSGVSIQIYALGFLRDRLIGSVRFLLSNLLKNPSFTALQIRRPSGSFHGILNVGVMLLADSDFPGFRGIWAMGHRDLMRHRRNSLAPEPDSQPAAADGKELKSRRAWSGGKLFLCGLVPQKEMSPCPSDREIETNRDHHNHNLREIRTSSEPLDLAMAIGESEGKERLRLRARRSAKLRLARMELSQLPSDQDRER